MSCRVVSGSSDPRLNICQKSHHPTSTSPASLGSCSRISFGAKLSPPMQRLHHARTVSGSVRIRASSTTIDVFCAPLESTETFYDLLGVSQSGTFSDIKRAFKQLARKYHPDVSPPDRIEEHTRRFIMVKEAYETLSDPHSREIYDRGLLANSYYPFSFSSARNDDESRFDDIGEWTSRWQSQVQELKRRSVMNNRGKNSWGARMRRQRD